MAPARPLLAVTGATGFIGRRFVEAARRSGYDVRLLCRRSGSSEPGGQVGDFDLCSTTPVEPAVLAGADAVVHLAARVPADHSDPAEARLCMEANAHGTLRLIEAMRVAGVRRLIQTTSANAYAPWIERPCELDPLHPETRVYYLASKVAQEHLARYRCGQTGAALTTLRLGSVYGPGQKAGAIPALMGKLLAGEPVFLLGGGGFGADFVHVDDVVAALLRFFETATDGVFNVGSGTRRTILEIVTLLASLIGSGSKLIECRDPGGCADRGFAALSIDKLKALGWAPVALEEGLAGMLHSLEEAAPETKSVRGRFARDGCLHG
ncbi:NAD-dependent epimerase/dehydratase family protein [Allosphingosinicella deserti]|uniref:NAD(P)-dependent oxidoreductase n=1 Tax=Allosphingosinicella deserti TaxID=2116704 RepID=A0A2P7QEJ6_9SPHN|nr:NAD(P)-dependent oxidoreductase [Sphingomonas deserti]PSJ36398.1 NAD(P)-dependent oxidoreductase [Sphingomonas deserti]